jgi:hypothetical protein
MLEVPDVVDADVKILAIGPTLLLTVDTII